MAPVRRLVFAFSAIVTVAQAALDLTAPAKVQVTVVDEAGSPIHAAAVELVARVPSAGEGDRSDTVVVARVAGVTDARGRAELSVPEPWTYAVGRPNAAPSASIRVTQQGYMPSEPLPPSAFTIFPSAQFSRQVVLDRERNTAIRFEQPDGSPLPFVNFHLPHDPGRADPVAGYFADAAGRARFVHGRLGPDAAIFVGGTRRPIGDDATITIRLTPREMAMATVARTIEGRVLLADGSPAAGWRIGWQIHEGQGSEFVSGTVRRRTEYLAFEREAVLPADGTFRLQAADRWLALISPQGVSFRFPLNPQAWPQAETHRLTLRVPPLRRLHRGQLVYADQPFLHPIQGPASGVPIGSVATVSDSGDLQWSLVRAGEDNPFRVTTTTGPDGRYEVPVYFGSEPWYRPAEGSIERQGNLARDNVSAFAPGRQAAPSPPPARPPQKHLKVSIEDETGAPIARRLGTDVRFEHVVPGERYGTGLLPDDTALHAFVPSPTAILTISASDRRLLEFSTTVALGPEDEQVIRLRVPEALMPQPLSGIILAPDGRPVTGATVVPYVFMNPSGTPSAGRSFVGSGVTTDAHGRFSMPAAPREGGLHIHGARTGTSQGTLPGWTAAPTFAADRREISVRLSPGGGILVRDRSQETGANLGYVLRPLQEMHHSWMASLERDPRTGHSSVSSIPPGRYRLIQYALERTQEQFDVGEVEIAAGRETTVDTARPSPPPRSTVEVLVTLDGRPFSGATVQASSAPLAPGELRGDVSDEAGRARIAGLNGEAITISASVPGQWTGSTTHIVGRVAAARIELKPAPAP